MPTSERAYARTSDPETSHAAALSAGDVRLSQAAVLRIFQEFADLTDEELVILYDMWASKYRLPRQSPSGLRTRRAELVRKGLVEFTGEKRPISTGRLARVWRLTEN